MIDWERAILCWSRVRPDGSAQLVFGEPVGARRTRCGVAVEVFRIGPGAQLHVPEVPRWRTGGGEGAAA